MLREGSVIEYTEQIAGEIASRFAGDPAGELELWLRLAHQREAMVTQLYEVAGFEARLGEAAHDPIAGLIGSVVRGIWAHEKSHTEFLSSIRSSSDAGGALSELQGLVEGWVVKRALRGLGLGRLLIAVGSTLGKVPEFARDMRQMSLIELVDFSAELETTARMGYQRILQIAAQIDDREARARALGFSFQYDVARIEREEAFHEGVFFEMKNWLAAAGAAGGPARPSLESCSLALHRLCSENLSVGAVRRAARATRPGLEALVPSEVHGSAWVSHGGLGGVFAAAGLPVPVIGEQS